MPSASKVHKILGIIVLRTLFPIGCSSCHSLSARGGNRPYGPCGLGFVSGIRELVDIVRELLMKERGTTSGKRSRYRFDQYLFIIQQHEYLASPSGPDTERGGRFRHDVILSLSTHNPADLVDRLFHDPFGFLRGKRDRDNLHGQFLAFPPVEYTRESDPANQEYPRRESSKYLIIIKIIPRRENKYDQQQANGLTVMNERVVGV